MNEQTNTMKVELNPFLAEMLSTQIQETSNVNTLERLKVNMESLRENRMQSVDNRSMNWTARMDNLAQAVVLERAIEEATKKIESLKQ